MKTHQYCILKNVKGAITVYTYEYTEKGRETAMRDFKSMASAEGMNEEIEFEFGVYRGEAIANVSPNEDCDLILVVSV